MKPKVKIVQTSQNRWHIESEQGHVLQDDITLSNPLHAKIYVENYISSFNTQWVYEVKPLNCGGVNRIGHCNDCTCGKKKYMENK